MYNRAFKRAAVTIVGIHIATHYYNHIQQQMHDMCEDECLDLDEKPHRFSKNMKKLHVMSGRKDNLSAPSVLNNLPNGLLDLSFYNCQYLTQLPDNLPDTITELCCCECAIHNLPKKLPRDLKKLTLIENKNLKRVDDVLPDGLCSLSCRCGTSYRVSKSDNKIEHIARFPPNIKDIDVSNTKLKTLPDLPPGLLTLECNYTPLEYLPDLPNSLTLLSVKDNYALFKNYPLLAAKINFIENKEDFMDYYEGCEWEWNMNQCFFGYHMPKVISYVNGINAQRRLAEAQE